MTGPERFATILTCIDGRIQRPLDEWARTHLDVEYVDTTTELRKGLSSARKRRGVAQPAAVRRFGSSASASGAVFDGPRWTRRTGTFGSLSAASPAIPWGV